MSSTDLEYLLNLIGPIILKTDTTFKKAILMPKNQEEWLQIAEGFEKRWNFPHCLGSIDGKHCILQTPANSGSDYFNYKSTFSIVLLALVDYHYNFLFADVGCQGRISDGGVFAHTSFCKTLYAGTLKLPEESILPGRTENVPYVFVADDAFALHKHILKPYGGTHENNSPKRTFNYRLSRARRVVENAFGILSSVFRVLRKPILLKEDNAALVVLSCVYLHNFLRRSKTSRNIYAPPGSFDIEPNTRKKIKHGNEMTIVPLIVAPSDNTKQIATVLLLTLTSTNSESQPFKKLFKHLPLVEITVLRYLGFCLYHEVML
ncbi:unnamed protein product [Acanthoscelides obtectus]|uniref:DDE Tnp4 domain-containing protein n=1 Tax=Acanthoscelides obtectus TaxID=200917 RepID=A0A9P0VN68_ACAOB|nr:unnamed protein product [Acanthoscelides obtectus]CAK1684301.1 Protein ALP1-like [Acanthoscelides obtectus]